MKALSAHGCGTAKSFTATPPCDRSAHFLQAMGLMLDELADVNMARWISLLNILCFLSFFLKFLPVCKNKNLMLPTAFYNFALCRRCDSVQLLQLSLPEESGAKIFTCKMPTARKICQAAIEFRAGTGQRAHLLRPLLLATDLNTNYKGCPPRAIGSRDDPVQKTHTKTNPGGNSTIICFLNTFPLWFSRLIERETNIECSERQKCIPCHCWPAMHPCMRLSVKSSRSLSCLAAVPFLFVAVTYFCGR